MTESLVLPRYKPEDIRRVTSFLYQQGTFAFPVLDTGLFSAAPLTADTKYTGYDNVWVRDNVHIAYAHYVCGQSDVACRSVAALSRYFQKHRHKFEAVIRGDADPGDPMNRPHVRFNGNTLEENAEKWSHAQNDALGYFLWIYCKLSLAGLIHPQKADWELLGLFPLYFRAAQYWQDEDSGHWEEARKIQASSIGVVVAALREMQRLMETESMLCCPAMGECVSVEALTELMLRGHAALDEILPSECAQEDFSKRRGCDAALLFLIYPMCVTTDRMADEILGNVETHLLGDHGVRRYQGDSFWCADYKALQRPEIRTSDVSDDMTARDSLLQPGQEAQWCIFDPLLSTIYGRRYAATHDPSCLEKQVHYLNRSLSQLTGPNGPFPEYRCPESYYLDKGRYVPNDITPLLWTQANLMTALHQMMKSSEKEKPLTRHSGPPSRRAGEGPTT